MRSTKFGGPSDGPRVTRREFARAGAAGAGGLWLYSRAAAAAAPPRDDRAVILLLLVGGPSQLDTWDPKPDAPAEIRGPYNTIATRVPGVRVCEHLPRSAARLDRLTLIRSLHHDAAPIHEAGHQLIQTGRLCGLGDDAPHVGSVVSYWLGGKHGIPASVMLPGPIGNTGVGVGHGQSAGRLGAEHEAVVPGPANGLAAVGDLEREPVPTRERYGPTRFGRDCLRARRFVEAGARFVTVNMYDSVFHQPTWDCHGVAPFSTLEDCARSVLPAFDQAFSALLDDLEERGRLDSTLVVATGEFGRTPRLNASGGRDHWPGAWSAVLAGGGTGGGQIIGATDPHGAYPTDRPVTPAELLATMYRALGIEHTGAFALAGLPRDAAGPVAEAFA